MIGLKISRQFINQREGKPKPIASFKRDFSRASSKLRGIATNLYWFILPFAPAVISHSNCFGICLATLN